MQASQYGKPKQPSVVLALRDVETCLPAADSPCNGKGALDCMMINLTLDKQYKCTEGTPIRPGL